MDEQEVTTNESSKDLNHRTILEYYKLVRMNITLLLGLILISSGLLNFKSNRYCDGTPSDFFACTNSATYYSYSPYTITVIVIGILLVAIWRLKARG